MKKKSLGVSMYWYILVLAVVVAVLVLALVLSKKSRGSITFKGLSVVIDGQGARVAGQMAKPATVTFHQIGKSKQDVLYTISDSKGAYYLVSSGDTVGSTTKVSSSEIPIEAVWMLVPSGPNTAIATIVPPAYGNGQAAVKFLTPLDTGNLVLKSEPFLWSVSK